MKRSSDPKWGGEPQVENRCSMAVPVLQAHDLYTASIWMTTIVATLLVAMTKFLTEQLEGQAREIGTLTSQAPQPELEPILRSCPLLLWNTCAPHKSHGHSRNK